MNKSQREFLSRLTPLLEAAGIPWTVERGGKHMQLRFGRRKVAISGSPSNAMALTHAVAQLRRMLASPEAPR